MNPGAPPTNSKIISVDEESNEENNVLHKWIREDEFEEVKKYTSNWNFKYYCNDRNESAAFTAITNRKFNIYAYLQTIGVNLQSNEFKELDKLSKADKNELRDILLSYFSTIQNSHIFYIISKLKTNLRDSVEECRKVLKSHLKTLNKIDDVKIILKVVQYAATLTVVVDLNEDHVMNICPGASEKERGRTFIKQGTIYIAAGGERSKNERAIGGTIAHELTHMAMELIFENDSDPYSKSDACRRDKFKKIVALAEKKFDDFKKEKAKDDRWEILLKGFDDSIYKRESEKKSEQESELIARVFHVLAQFEDGLEGWLEENFPELYDFYKNEVLPECEKFTENSWRHLQLRSLRKKNEDEGEIINIKKCSLSFRNIDRITTFLSKENKRIFALITNHTKLGLLRVFQGLFGEQYGESWDRFLVFKLENCLKDISDVEYLFNLEAAEMLILECPKDIIGDKYEKAAINKLIKIVEKKRNKKIIFIMKRSFDHENLKKMINENGLNDVFVEETDKEIFVNDLNKKSHKEILRKVVLFQGKEANLNELICPLTKGRLDEMKQDNNFENLKGLIEELNGDIFIINGNLSEKIISNLEVNIEQLKELKDFKNEASSRQKLLLVKNEITNEDFEIFRNEYPKKNIFWIGIKNQESQLSFTILHFHPDSYFKRDLNECINSEVIQTLLEDKNIEIGRKPMKTSNLEGAYTNVMYEMNFENLKTLINGYFENIFIINGNLGEEVISNLGVTIERLKELKDFKNEASTHQKLFLINNEIGNEDFKIFCNINANKTIYWINIKNKKSDLTFKLLKIYNPFFYINQEFKCIEKNKACNKILVKEEKLEKEFQNSDTIIMIDDKKTEKHGNIYRLNYKDIKSTFKEFDKSGKKIHLFRKKNGALTWVKSNCPLGNLRPFIYEESIEKNKTINENDLVKDYKLQKVVIISGIPGIGKTTSLIKLYEMETYKSPLVDTYWVMNINLRDHEKVIQMIDEDNFDISKALQFFESVDPSLRIKLSKTLLKSALIDDSFKKELLIAFDGFAELPNADDRRKSISLFKFLKSNTKAKIWVTTNIYFEKYLEDELSTFAIRLVPVEDNALKEEFLMENVKNRWGSLFSQIFEPQKSLSLLQEISQNIIHKSKLIFNGDLKNLIGTPLQFNLLLEDFVGSLPDSSENSNTENNLLNVYQNFIDKKYEIFFGKNWQKQKEKLEKDHEELAKVLILKKDSESPKILSELKKSILPIGLTKFDNEKFNFVHHTFFDYFIMQLLVKNLLNQPYKIVFEKAANFVFNEVLVKDQYKLIRSFMNDYFKRREKIESLVFNEGLCEEIFLSCKGKKIDVCGFCVAIQENHNNLLKFLFSIKVFNADWYEILIHKEICSQNLLHFAIQNKNRFAIDEIIELTCRYNIQQKYKYLRIINEKGSTALHLAFENGNDGAIEKIIKIVKEFDLHRQYKLLSMADEHGQTILHLAIEKDKKPDLILEIISQFKKWKQQKLLNMVDNLGETALHLALRQNKDFAVTKIAAMLREFSLDVQNEFLNIRNKNGENVLFLAVKNRNNDVFRTIFEIVEKFDLHQQYDLLNNADEHGQTIFHLAIQRTIQRRENNTFVRIIEMIARFSLKRQYNLLTATNEWGQTDLHIAEVDKNGEILEKIIEMILKLTVSQQYDLLNLENENEHTILHLIVSFRNEFALEKINEIISKFNLEQRKSIFSNLNDGGGMALLSGGVKKNVLGLN